MIRAISCTDITAISPISIANPTRWTNPSRSGEIRLPRRTISTRTKNMRPPSRAGIGRMFKIASERLRVAARVAKVMILASRLASATAISPVNWPIPTGPTVEGPSNCGFELPMTMKKQHSDGHRFDTMPCSKCKSRSTMVQKSHKDRARGKLFIANAQTVTCEECGYSLPASRYDFTKVTNLFNVYGRNYPTDFNCPKCTKLPVGLPKISGGCFLL